MADKTDQAPETTLPDSAGHTTHAVVLAAGLGTRMQQSDATAALSAQQAELARSGAKAMMSVGRPFLDHVLHRVADAGCRHVCLVIGPHHDQIRRYYRDLRAERLHIDFAIQQQPLGTAHALSAAQSWAEDRPLLVLNGDNCYPTEALRLLCSAPGPAVAGFDRDALIRQGNIPAARIARFAILQPRHDGCLQAIREKPSDQELAALQGPVMVSMNCWRFGPDIFRACRAIDRSPRGEYELPDAVMYSMTQLGQCYRVFPVQAGVLDLSCQSDIAGVQQRLQDEDVRL